jgi:predicted nucleic acid-binding protein
VDYFDTSALLPYYRPEPLSATVQNLLLAAEDNAAISSLVDVEIASALARLVRLREFSDHDAASVHNAFASDINKGCFQYLAVDTAAFRQAQQFLLERKSSLRTLDALHLACAALAGARLVTADRALADAAEVHGVSVLLLQH